MLPSSSGRQTLLVVESAFLASATAVMFFINNNFPILLVRNLYALPVALVYLRWGARSSLITAVVSALVVLILMGPVRSLQYVVVFGSLGLLFGFLWRRRVNWGISLVFSTLLMTMGTAFELAFLSLLFGENIWAFSLVQATGLVNWLLQLWGSLDQADVSTIQVFAVLSVVTRSFVYVAIAHILAWLIFDRLQVAIPAPPRWLTTLLE